MDFNDTPEEAKFRKEVDWLKDNAPLKEGPADSWRASSEEEGLKEVKKWQKKLHEGGWVFALAKRIWGRESTPIESNMGGEVSKFKVPGGYLEIGQGMAGPVMMMYATDEQKERYLPPLATAEIWCHFRNRLLVQMSQELKLKLNLMDISINGQKV